MTELHLIEEDLYWFQLNIPEQVLSYEIEQYMGKVTEFSLAYPDEDDGE